MNYREINDYEQLYLIKENDDDSFNLVFQKYRPIIISLAKRYYKKVNYHYCELDDLIQEGYIERNDMPRKQPTTLEECNAELERTRKQLQQYENRNKMLNRKLNRYPTRGQ